MASVRCTIVRWVNDDPQPGLVEARLIDASGKPWIFHEKPPIFTADFVSADTQFPIPGIIRCTIRKPSAHAVPTILRIDTALPDGVESIEGQHLFHVQSDSVQS